MLCRDSRYLPFFLRYRYRYFTSMYLIPSAFGLSSFLFDYPGISFNQKYTITANIVFLINMAFLGKIEKDAFYLDKFNIKDSFEFNLMFRYLKNIYIFVGIIKASLLLSCVAIFNWLSISSDDTGSSKFIVSGIVNLLFIGLCQLRTINYSATSFSSMDYVKNHKIEQRPSERFQYGSFYKHNDFDIARQPSLSVDLSMGDNGGGVEYANQIYDVDLNNEEGINAAI